MQCFILLRDNDNVPLSLGGQYLPIFTSREKAETFLGHPEVDQHLKDLSRQIGPFDVASIDTSLEEIRRKSKRARDKIHSYVVDPETASVEEFMAKAQPLFQRQNRHSAASQEQSLLFFTCS